VRSVGWAKALLRRAHHYYSEYDWMVGTSPDAFASGDFAHPTVYLIATGDTVEPVPP
jgi:hypothetical protein